MERGILVLIAICRREFNTVINKTNRAVIERRLPILRMRRIYQNNTSFYIPLLIFSYGFIAKQRSDRLTSLRFPVWWINEHAAMPRLSQTVILFGKKHRCADDCIGL